jgi:hypothetical protein
MIVMRIILKSARKQLIQHDVIYRWFVELYCPSVSVYLTTLLQSLYYMAGEGTNSAEINFHFFFWISRNRVRNTSYYGRSMGWGKEANAPLAPKNILSAYKILFWLLSSRGVNKINWGQSRKKVCVVCVCVYIKYWFRPVFPVFLTFSRQMTYICVVPQR